MSDSDRQCDSFNNITSNFALVLIFTCFTFFISACSTEEEALDIEVVEVTKWLNDYRSAYSPTYDAGRPELNDEENQWLIEQGLFIDYEIVTYNYDNYSSLVDYLVNELIPHGFGYFGHGHKHDHHDNEGYEYSLASFTQNYESMKSYGLQPVSYAYPHGAGRLPETRQALKESGFLNGRLFEPEFEGYGPYITPGDETEPPDWFALPSLRMEDIDFEGYSDAVNNPEEFKVHLNESIQLGSWLISTYHGIGFDGETYPEAWGFYRRENFYEEMLYVKEKRDQGEVWLATMDDVTLYIKQRNKAVYTIEQDDEQTFSLFLDDGLDNDFYHMPLTLRLSLNPDLAGRYLTIRSPEDGEILFSKEINSDELLVNLHPSGIRYELTVE